MGKPGPKDTSKLESGSWQARQWQDGKFFGHFDPALAGLAGFQPYLSPRGTFKRLQRKVWRAPEDYQAW